MNDTKRQEKNDTGGSMKEAMGRWGRLESEIMQIRLEKALLSLREEGSDQNP